MARRDAFEQLAIRQDAINELTINTKQQSKPLGPDVPAFRRSSAP
jgi:hypothetical protein